jgi:hypothetical protein
MNTDARVGRGTEPRIDAPATHPRGAWVKAILAAALILNLSEVVRYFGIVMPRTREHLDAVPGVAPMDLAVFALWGVWDTILLAVALIIYELVSRVCGRGLGTAWRAGVLTWATLFLLFWIAMINMRLATTSVALIAVSWALIELIATTAAADWILRNAPRQPR